MCLTDSPDNRIPFQKPEGFEERDYELLFRNFEAGQKRIPWINSAMPNRKTDTNNSLGFSTDFIGQNYDYSREICHPRTHHPASPPLPAGFDVGVGKSPPCS
jgi:hypothetical protein